jgi:hypothetical protein
LVVPTKSTDALPGAVVGVRHKKANAVMTVTSTNPNPKTTNAFMNAQSPNEKGQAQTPTATEADRKDE